MIISPLEQFNILSLSDFSPAGGFEILYASFLLWAWSLFYLYPLSLFNYFFNNDFILFSFLTSALVDFYQLFLSNFFLLLSNILSYIFLLLNVVKLFNLVDVFYNFYNSCLSYIWYISYQNINVLYSTNNLSFITLPYNFLFYNDNVTLSNSVVTLDHFSSMVNWNLSLISGNLGSFLVNFYFIFFELFLSIKTFFYDTFISSLLNISSCDFTYLVFSLNSSTIWQILGISFVSLLFLSTTWRNSLTLVSKNTWQTWLELFYEFILNIVNENAGPKGRKFFPLIFTTFIIILTCNVLGMIPYSFTVTSHLIVTFSTALAIFTGMNILGILKHGKHFLSLFFPPGAPLALAPLLVLIEFISYIFRVLSLSIRLFANLMSGHTLLKILATFSWGVVSLWGIFLLPVGIILIVTGLEMAIAFLQAYIFAVLLCIYLNDAFNLH